MMFCHVAQERPVAEPHMRLSGERPQAMLGGTHQMEDQGRVVAERIAIDGIGDLGLG